MPDGYRLKANERATSILPPSSPVEHKLKLENMQIIFEVTADKTEVITTDSKGNIETLDITGTEVEKHFTKLLRKLSAHKLENQILDAIDIDKWKES